MEISPELEALLEDRLAEAVDLLRQSIRVDVYNFAFEEVGKRLRQRPHFTARTPPQSLVQFRNYMIDRCEDLLADLGHQIRDLLLFYGTKPREPEAENRALEKILSNLEPMVQEVLQIWSMPGDDYPDRPDDRSVDLNARYEAFYKPSSSVLLAWQRVRDVDRARHQLETATKLPLEQTFELAFWAPEALPPDTSKPPTIA